MTTNHTPGPWAVTRGIGNFPAVNGARYAVASLSFCGSTLGELRGNTGKADEIEANARLIAAAPDMLEALNRALFVLESPCVAHLVNGAGTLDIVRTAIARAEGREG